MLSIKKKEMKKRRILLKQIPEWSDLLYKLLDIVVIIKGCIKIKKAKGYKTNNTKIKKKKRLLEKRDKRNINKEVLPNV